MSTTTLVKQQDSKIELPFIFDKITTYQDDKNDPSSRVTILRDGTILRYKVSSKYDIKKRVITPEENERRIEKFIENMKSTTKSSKYTENSSSTTTTNSPCTSITNNNHNEKQNRCTFKEKKFKSSYLYNKKKYTVLNVSNRKKRQIMDKIEKNNKMKYYS